MFSFERLFHENNLRLPFREKPGKKKWWWWWLNKRSDWICAEWKLKRNNFMRIYHLILNEGSFKVLKYSHILRIVSFWTIKNVNFSDITFFYEYLPLLGWMISSILIHIEHYFNHPSSFTIWRDFNIWYKSRKKLKNFFTILISIENFYEVNAI
jgi:hypothetical protein